MLTATLDRADLARAKFDFDVVGHCARPDAAVPKWVTAGDVFSATWVTAGDVFSATRTGDELSVVCREESVPSGTLAEAGWRCPRVAGAMPLTLVGVLASLTRPIAAAGVGVFAVSTFGTDCLFVKGASSRRRLPP